MTTWGPSPYDPANRSPALYPAAGVPVPVKRSFLFPVLFLAGSLLAHGQAGSTASRAGDLQVGGLFTIAQSDYTSNNIRGMGFYADFDFRGHYGVELNFHQLNDPNSDLYERTYEVGGRYVRHYGRFAPYAKVMYGRGVFNSPVYSYYVPVACPVSTPSCTGTTIVTTNFNLAYNMLAFGGGIDYSILPRIKVRADYEYQMWNSGPGLTNGLSPQLMSIGVAYHFPAGRPRYP